MTALPDFDPFRELGVAFDAPTWEVTLAWRAKLRLSHPDALGNDAGLERTKRLNIARDWLVDPELRALLPRSGTSELAGRQSPPAHGTREATNASRSRAEPKSGGGYYQRFTWTPSFDPFAFDFGQRSVEIKAFLRHILELTADERIRLASCSGVSFGWGFRRFLDDDLLERSEALEAAIMSLGDRAKVASAAGMTVLHSYADWLLLRDFLNSEITDTATVERLEAMATEQWRAVAGHDRYGPRTDDVEAMLQTARTLSLAGAQVLSREWRRRFDREPRWSRVGAEYLPVPPISSGHTIDQVAKLSGQAAADAASHIQAPAGLRRGHLEGFRAGLRLAAYTVALSGGDDRWIRAWMEPWRRAQTAPRTGLIGRLRIGQWW